MDKVIVAVILAAGQGTRMKSAVPKVLHMVNNRPMVNDIIATVKLLGISRVIVVVGHKADMVKTYLNKVEVVAQSPLLGTGHAVLQTKELLSEFTGDVLVLYGDTPLLTIQTIEKLIEKHRLSEASCTLLSVKLKDPKGYGRIVRDNSQNITKIVEDRDASAKERSIKEINVGAYCFKCKDLFENLQEVTPDNIKGEYYLTDVISIMWKKGLSIESVLTTNQREAWGVNTKDDLTRVRKVVKQRNLR
jgi:bifunctional UDP-N-acetylglucosamine pyrophosphorylase/glucosamine-1-phosphate N-acetyltransferase